MYKLKVSNTKFKNEVKQWILGLKKVHNYYGMMEQTGSVFRMWKRIFSLLTFSDILIRNSNLDLCNTKEAGLIQTLSLLPVSYPGKVY